MRGHWHTEPAPCRVRNCSWPGGGPALHPDHGSGLRPVAGLLRDLFRDALVLGDGVCAWPARRPPDCPSRPETRAGVTRPGTDDAGLCLYIAASDRGVLAPSLVCFCVVGLSRSKDRSLG